MTTSNLEHPRTVVYPRVVSRADWLAARKALLATEKEITRYRDALNAERRRLPMVRIDKEYVFHDPNGRTSLRDLFEGRRQLVIYHFMFDPSWDEGCPSCSHCADNFAGAVVYLAACDTAFAAISRAPIAKIERFKKRMGWGVPWLSSFGGDFNYDFQVTVDEAYVEYNYRPYYADAREMFLKGKGPAPGEMSGLSVFLREGEHLYHAYSAYQRGLDPFINTYNYLDHTPLGRQEDGRPMAWVCHHDKY